MVWAYFLCDKFCCLAYGTFASRSISYAYPFLSIGYIIAAFVGYFYFGESMTLNKIGGIIIICLGVFLLYRS